MKNLQRTGLYEKIYFNGYVFVSPNITVNQFHVLPDEVSDHAALYLDFGLAEIIDKAATNKKQSSIHIKVS